MRIREDLFFPSRYKIAAVLRIFFLTVTVKRLDRFLLNVESTYLVQRVERLVGKYFLSPPVSKWWPFGGPFLQLLSNKRLGRNSHEIEVILTFFYKTLVFFITLFFLREVVEKIKVIVVSSLEIQK